MNIVQPQSTVDAARDLVALEAQLGAAPGAATLRPVGLGGVMIGSGVLDGIADVVAEVRWPVGDVVLFADVRPMFGADTEVKATIEARVAAAGLTVRRVTVGDHSAHARADAATLDEATAASAGASVLLSVGSGTVVDLAKTISARLDGVPHVAVQTAASVNGFSDDLSVLLVDGVKHTTLHALGRPARDRHRRDRARTGRAQPRRARRSARDLHGARRLAAGTPRSARTTATRRLPSTCRACTCTTSSPRPAPSTAAIPRRSTTCARR